MLAGENTAGWFDCHRLDPDAHILEANAPFDGISTMMLSVQACCS